MWRLLMTDKARQWVEAGSFGSITASVRRIIEIEDHDGAGIHLEFHVCTITNDDDANDADALGYLEYSGKRAIYGIKRAVQ
jgi:hypothetical protein